MKYISTIEILIKRAERRGEAYLYRRGNEVYTVKVEAGIYTLKHYGTTTIEYDNNSKQLLSYYGESISDRDSMNTFLSYLGEHRYYFRYGPRMGFVMEEEHGAHV